MRSSSLGNQHKPILKPIGFSTRFLLNFFLVGLFFVFLALAALGIEFLLIPNYQGVDATYVAVNSAEECGYVNYVFGGIPFSNIRIDSYDSRLIGSTVRVFVDPTSPEKIWALLDMAIIPSSIAVIAGLLWLMDLVFFIGALHTEANRHLLHRKDLCHVAKLAELGSSSVSRLGVVDFYLWADYDGKRYKSQTCQGQLPLVLEAVSRQEPVDLYVDQKGHYFLDMRKLNQHLLKEQAEMDRKKEALLPDPEAFKTLSVGPIFSRLGYSLMILGFSLFSVAMIGILTYAAFTMETFNYEDFVGGAVIMPFLAILGFLDIDYSGFFHWKVEKGVLSFKRPFRKALILPLNQITSVRVDSVINDFESHPKAGIGSILFSDGVTEIELDLSKDAFELACLLDPSLKERS